MDIARPDGDESSVTTVAQVGFENNIDFLPTPEQVITAQQR
jgi:hypothetical protein